MNRPDPAYVQGVWHGALLAAVLIALVAVAVHLTIA